MNLAKVNRILEIFWWSMTALTLILVIVLVAVYGSEKWSFYFLVPVISAIMALIRRFMAKRLERSSSEKKDAKA